MKDYYYILGLDRHASESEVKQAYRKLSKKFHPDVNHGDLFFESRFKEILEAYEVLSDTGKRYWYDAKLKDSGSDSDFDKDKYKNEVKREYEEQVRQEQRKAEREQERQRKAYEEKLKKYEIELKAYKERESRLEFEQDRMKFAYYKGKQRPHEHFEKLKYDYARLKREYAQKIKEQEEYVREQQEREERFELEKEEMQRENDQELLSLKKKYDEVVLEQLDKKRFVLFISVFAAALIAFLVLPKGNFWLILGVVSLIIVVISIVFVYKL